jgi:hypothetical protein
MEIHSLVHENRDNRKSQIHSHKPIWINSPFVIFTSVEMATKYIQITITQKLRSPVDLQFSLTTNSLCIADLFFLEHT